jgi:hypothetical protein
VAGVTSSFVAERRGPVQVINGAEFLRIQLLAFLPLGIGLHGKGTG